MACTGPVCFRKEGTDPKEKDEDLLEEKKTEDALLPEGWNQQVGAEDLLHPERSSWRIRKTTRKRRSTGEIRKSSKSRCWAMIITRGVLPITTGEKVALKNSASKRNPSSARRGEKEGGFGEAMRKWKERTEIRVEKEEKVRKLVQNF